MGLAPEARAGGIDGLLVGGNDGDYLMNGEVEQDQARLMVVRERAVDEGDRDVRTTSGAGTITMPLDASEVLVYSHPLEPAGAAFVEGGQYLIDAKVVTAVSARARFSTHMFVTRDPGDRQPSGFAGVSPESIGEHNGINCTPGTSPCTTRKVAVFRIAEDTAGPLYVNLIARSEVPGGGPSTVTVRRADGSIESTRYPADLR